MTPANLPLPQPRLNELRLIRGDLWGVLDNLCCLLHPPVPSDRERALAESRRMDDWCHGPPIRRGRGVVSDVAFDEPPTVSKTNEFARSNRAPTLSNDVAPGQTEEKRRISSREIVPRGLHVIIRVG